MVEWLSDLRHRLLIDWENPDCKEPVIFVIRSGTCGDTDVACEKLKPLLTAYPSMFPPGSNELSDDTWCRNTNAHIEIYARFLESAARELRAHKHPEDPGGRQTGLQQLLNEDPQWPHP